MIPYLRLAETLASRLCHDLIAPIGATHTGLELLSTTSPSHSTDFQEILHLILHSTESATAKATFFRAAFGKNGETLSFPETLHLAQKYLKESKLTLHVDPPLEESSFIGAGRLFLTALLWLSECAPKGGTLNVTIPKEETFSLCFSLKADPLILQPGLLEILEGKTTFEDLTPRTVPCYFMWQLLQEKEGSLSFTYTPSTPALTLELKG